MPALEESSAQGKRGVQMTADWRTEDAKPELAAWNQCGLGPCGVHSRVLLCQRLPGSLRMQRRLVAGATLCKRFWRETAGFRQQIVEGGCVGRFRNPGHQCGAGIIRLWARSNAGDGRSVGCAALW